MDSCMGPEADIQHNTPQDAWSVFNGKVYNITPYLKYHPGGVDELMRVAGRDGTKLFSRSFYPESRQLRIEYIAIWVIWRGERLICSSAHTLMGQPGFHAAGMSGRHARARMIVSHPSRIKSVQHEPAAQFFRAHIPHNHHSRPIRFHPHHIDCIGYGRSVLCMC